MKSVLVSACVVLGGLTLLGTSATPASAAATTTVDLGSAANFSVLAGAAATLPGSNLPGQVGARAAITSNALTVFGSTIHSVNDAATGTAIGDANTAYQTLRALPATGTLSGDDLAGQTVTPGVYHRVAAFAMTTPVTFDAQGDPDAFFIMQSDAALNTTAGTTMNLRNGAQANHIFWVTDGAATLGASSRFFGTMLSGAAITVGASSYVCGRALSVSFAVTLDADAFCALPAIVARTAPTIGGFIPALTANAPMSTTLAVTGSPAPTLTVTAGTLPAGLSLSQTGVIAGTPTGAGPYDFTVTATNSAGSASKRFTGTVAAAPVAPTTIGGTIPALTVGAPASTTLIGNGSPAPTFAVTAGELPTGFTLNPTTGVISGTPTTGGPFWFTVTATNIAGSASKTFSGTVAPAPVAPTINGSIPALTVGAPASTTLSATGSPAPTFAVTAGSLPVGLSLNPTTGVIAGTPTTAGPYNFTVTATNIAGTASKTFNGTIAAATVAPTISGSIPALTVNTPVSTPLTATGSPAPTFAVTSGTIPAGLTLNPTTGVISGTPTTAGPYNFTVTATNVAGSAPKTFTGTIAPAAVAPISIGGFIPALRVGAPASTTLTATGSPTPTFAVIVGSLPAGLSLDPTTGVIAGTPTTAGPYAFTIKASNIAGSARKDFSGTVAPASVAPTTISGTMPAMTVRSPMSTPLTANGSPAPTFTISAGTLPAGLSLNPTTGVISGTPTTAGPYAFTVKATNSAGSITKSFSGNVAQCPTAPTVISGTIPGMRVGTSVSTTLTANGNPAPTFTISAGTLPAGLTLNSTTGVISGTPTTVGTFNFTVKATNSVGSTTKAYTATVCGCLR